MGVASAKFDPAAAYDAIRPYCLVKQAESPEGVEGLTVEMEGESKSNAAEEL